MGTCSFLDTQNIYKIMRALLLTTALTIALSACSSMDFVPQKKHYSIGKDNSFSFAKIKDKIGEKITLPDLSINRLGDGKQVGKLFIDNQFTTNKSDHWEIDLTRERSLYKASTPLFYLSNDRRHGANFSLSVERGREVIAGIEFSIPLDFGGKKK